jgi:Icc-related predicted phosphoesterase
VRIVLISDTHTFHNKVAVPCGDVLVHAGDMALSGSVREVQDCLDWMNSSACPVEHVVVVAGNHDWACVTHLSELNFGRVHYLENSSVNIGGKNFYGSPVQPEFCNWAFNVPRGPAIKKYWDLIPGAGLVDVLITHGPPMGILDQSIPDHTDHLGCEDLAKQVEISKPLVHVFGHIHGSAGQRDFRDVRYVNAAVVNEAYRVVNPPRVLDI